MLDVPEEALAPEQGEDVEMIDALAEGVIPVEGTMEASVDSRIRESNSQATLVEELKLFTVDPSDLTKTFQVGK